MSKSRKTTRLMNRSLMHTAAKLHYLEGASQLEVSRRMQVSTATVSRLLAHAREEGIVRIQVADLDETDEIGDELCNALKLRAVRVLESGKGAALSSQVNALLSEAHLAAGSVIAIGWGRTVQSIISSGLPKIPGAVVVPTTGGMHETASHFQINEFVRTAAEQVEGEARFLHAPSRASAELRSVLTKDPETARILEYWSKADVAILGIGDFKRATTDHAAGTENHGRIVGDVLRHYFNEDGEEITWPGQDELMAIGRAQLRRIPLSIGVATGKEKIRAIIGAARSGMINVLVTDTTVARLMLERLENA